MDTVVPSRVFGSVCVKFPLTNSHEVFAEVITLTLVSECNTLRSLVLLTQV